LDFSNGTLSSTGRRVERLLLAGAALVAVALVAFYLAFAARHYAEDRVGVGMESLALLIEGDDKVLQRFYELESQRQKLAQKKNATGENFYGKALDDKVARASALSGAEAQSLRALVSEDEPPADLVKSLRERKKTLDERPATVAGVVVPNSSLGTRLPAAFLANLLIIALAPVIILWLAALRLTRSREQREADEERYPHALNLDVVPLYSLVARYTAGRWSLAAWAQAHAAVLAFLRMALLALLVVPMIAAYIAAVATLGMGSDGGWLRALYAFIVMLIMVIQSIDLLAAEAPVREHEQQDDEFMAREEPSMNDES